MDPMAITVTGQQFRDLDVGATVVLSDRVERTVVAVVDHPRLDDVEFVKICLQERMLVVPGSGFGRPGQESVGSPEIAARENKQ